jgi:hypothetical protein
MAVYYIPLSNGERKYIKKIDYKNTKLTFTKDRNKAYEDRDGYYTTPTRDMIRRGFKEEYPEVENLKIDY